MDGQPNTKVLKGTARETLTGNPSEIMRNRATTTNGSSSAEALKGGYQVMAELKAELKKVHRRKEMQQHSPYSAICWSHGRHGISSNNPEGALS